ncbi:MAG: hypothetical protein ACFFD4_35775 [Candidatus Odinarchaeota archaeon]
MAAELSSKNTLNPLFEQLVSAVEEHVTMSAYYTVTLACKDMGISKEELREEHLSELIPNIRKRFEKYFPTKAYEIERHLDKIAGSRTTPKTKKRSLFSKIFGK